MAGTKVRGITIELSADASGVRDALKDVNNAIKTTSKELKDIDSLLKFDPGNTELLAQKHDALARQLENTRDKADTLRQAQADLASQMENGGTEEQQRQMEALERELIATEQQEKKYATQLEEVDGKQEEVAKSAKESADKTEDFGEKAKAAGTKAAAAFTAVVAAVGAVVKGFADAIEETAEYGDHIDKMSQKMGISAEAYQEWDFVMQHCGTSMDTLKSSMKTLTTAAETGNDAFTKLGITQEEIASMSQEDLFEKTLYALQNLDDETQRTYLSGQLLGRGATELGALLNMSAEETDDMRKQVHELGGVLSDDAVKASAQFEDSLLNMNTAMDGVKRTMASQFLPGVASIMDGITQIIAGDTEEGIATIQEGIDNVITVMNEMLPTFIETGGQLLISVITGIVENLPELLPAIIDVLLTIVDTLIENLPMIIDAALQLILALAEGLVEALPEMIPAILDVVLGIVEYLLDNIDLLIECAIQLIIGLGKGLIQAIPVLIQHGPEIIKGIVDGIISGIGQIWDVGVQIVQGLWEGIKSGASWLWEKVTGWLSDLWGGIKEFFGIASPSKQMAWIGEMLDEGLAGGIEDSADEAISSAKDMIKGIDSTIRDGISDVDGIGVGLNGNYSAVVSAKGSAASNPAIGVLNTIYGLLNQYMPQLSNQQMVLDSGELVGAIAPKMSNEFGTMQRMALRGV